MLRDTLDGPRGASDLLLPRVDLTALLPNPAARWLEAHGGTVGCGESVRAIVRRDDGWQLDDRPERYDGVVLATSATAAARILDASDLAPAARALLDSFEFEPIYTCYVQYPAEYALPAPMIGLTGALTQWLFDRGQLGGPRGLVAGVISARGEHEAHALDELALRVHAEIAARFPGTPAPGWRRVIAERRGTFSCRAGLARPPNDLGVVGLALAGDYTASDYPGTLESAVRSGLAAARLLG